LTAVKAASNRAGDTLDGTVLRVRLLGALEVELTGAVIASPASRRPWAVFAYLALAGRPVSRSELATQFWPDVLDQSARASLRSALWALRREVGDLLDVDRDRDRVTLSADWVDVHEFDRLTDGGVFEEALALCRGELLEGVEDEWAISARQRHRERVITLLEQLAHQCEERGGDRAAIEWTRRQLECDPFDEEAHRRLITRLARAGDRAGALRTYRMLAERLRRELGVSPSRQTREVIELLRADGDVVATPIDRPRVPAGTLPLIGREPELAALTDAWRTAMSGSGVAAVIRGEAGIGKTRLMTELRMRAMATGLVASSGALDLGGSAPLSLWAELIRELLPVLPAPPMDAVWPEDLAVLTSELPTHFMRAGAATSTVAPDLQRTRLFEAVVALLGWATRERPLLLVLEDIHTADTPTLELAGYIARRAAGLPVMIGLTRRQLPVSPDADQLEHALRARGLLTLELDLGPLTSEPVASLARTAADLSDADVERVVQSAEGNALLAVETARALARGVQDVAPSLLGSMRATLAPLDGDVRRLIELVAVAGRGIDPTELAELSLDDPDGSAAEALGTGVLHSSDGRLTFGHALLRDAVYEETAEPRRRGLHQRWAEALLESEQSGAIPRPAEAARHLRLAGADAAAVPQLARAASDARAVAALDQAVAYLDEALELAPADAQLWLELGELEGWRGQRERAEAAFDRAAELLDGGDPLTLARAWLRRGAAYHGPICYPRGVLESSRVALELLDRAAEPVAAERHEAVTMQAWAQAVAGSVEEADRLLDDLDAETERRSDTEIFGVAHARAFALMRRGRFVEAYGDSIAAGDAASRAGRPDLAYGAWINVAAAAVAAGEFDRALEFLDRGDAEVANRGLTSIEFQLLAGRSFVLTRMGSIEAARGCAEAQQQLAEQVGAPDLLAAASHDRGLVELASGEFALAAVLLAAALVQDAPISRPLTRLALAEACARCGQLEQAADELRRTVLEPVGPGDFADTLVPRLTYVQGLIALAGNDRELADRRLRESIAGWTRLLDRANAGDAMRAVLADLGRPVVGLVEPGRELARVRRELETLEAQGAANAVVP
jgi:DNA-binding SARP family transcriptional activator